MTPLTPTERLHADLRNGHYAAWLRHLDQTKDLPAEQLQELQFEEFKRIVRYAHENSAGYRRWFEQAGVGPDDVRSLEDVAKLPFTTKELFRDHLDDFSTPVPKRFYVTTGGSTGIPFGMYRDPVAFGKELASKAHQYYRVGWREGDRQLVFRGLAITAKSRIQFFPRFNELRCSSYYLTPERMERYRRAALRYQPQWLRCYPSSGFLFAQFLRETGRSFPQLKGILCASENLYDHQKELLQRMFNCRVFSHYGHYEMAVLAGFCEHEDTYHVLPQYGYAELLDPDGRRVSTPGQVGEIVATSFIMHATPFIRYRTRDFAVFKSQGCPACGRPYEVWERIEGRLQEFILTGAGRLISMTAMNMHDNIFDQLRQFQFLQEKPGELTFTFVPKPTCTGEIVADIQRRLLIKLGDDMRLAMQPVAEIEPTKRGKHRFLIQKLSLQNHDV